VLLLLLLQGGDPTGTGLGGESIYGPSFKDELDSRLLHRCVSDDVMQVFSRLSLLLFAITTSRMSWTARRCTSAMVAHEIDKVCETLTTPHTQHDPTKLHQTACPLGFLCCALEQGCLLPFLLSSAQFWLAN
jgi:hypothetical protein